MIFMADKKEEIHPSHSTKTNKKQIKATHEKMARLEGLSLPGIRDYPKRVNEDNEA
jgi:hypothetical protein